MLMLTVIVSDLHIGSEFFSHERFDSFLDTLPDDATLVLNGDTLDDPHHALPDRHQTTFDRLIDESKRRNIIWIYGNHDDDVMLPDSEGIQFRTDYAIDKRLYIIHGHYFDNVMPYNRVFMRIFNLLHRLRILLGASPVHIAQYAKKWPWCYRYLRKNVRMNAVEYCQENDYAAITCGHVHFPEDIQLDGIRYINTGCWTEPETYYIIVTDTDVEFKKEPGTIDFPI
jgi:UDP-2,3-diacylglucosamine pyrophosphatase LpxH